MRIIYLHQFFNTPDMPGSPRSYEMARRLVLGGHTVFMVTTKRDRYQIHKPNYTNEDGIHVFWLPVSYSNTMSFIRRMSAFIIFSLFAVKKSSAFKADLIFATSTPLTIAIPAIILKKIKHIPMITEIRDLWPELPIAIGALKSKISIYFAKKLEKTTYNYSTKIIALSNGIKEGISCTGFPENHIYIIPNFSDINRFSIPKAEGIKFRHNFSWMGNNPLVVYCGALGRINGVTYMVKLAKEMEEINNDVRFLVMGEGYEKELIISFAKQQDVLSKNFYILDPMPKVEIPKLLSAATLSTSLFIDLKEMESNSANKFFDALAAGCPIMINYGGWQKDLIENETLGITVSPDNPNQAAQKLNKLLRDKEMLKLMSLNTRKIAEQEFSSDLLTEKFLNVIQYAYNSNN